MRKLAHLTLGELCADEAISKHVGPALAYQVSELLVAPHSDKVNPFIFHVLNLLQKVVVNIPVPVRPQFIFIAQNAGYKHINGTTLEVMLSCSSFDQLQCFSGIPWRSFGSKNAYDLGCTIFRCKIFLLHV